MKKNDLLQMRISADLKAAADARAEAMSMTTSEYVRYLILEDIRNNPLPAKE